MLQMPVNSKICIGCGSTQSGPKRVILHCMQKHHLLELLKTDLQAKKSILYLRGNGKILKLSLEESNEEKLNNFIERLLGPIRFTKVPTNISFYKSPEHQDSLVKFLEATAGKISPDMTNPKNIMVETSEQDFPKFLLEADTIITLQSLQMNLNFLTLEDRLHRNFYCV